MSQPININKQDWPAIAAYLETKGHCLDSDFEIQQLSGGSANFNFLISMNGKKAVLRRPPDGPLPPGSNDVAREYKVLSHLGDAFPPAPRGLLLCDDENVIGVPFCISEFREGVCVGQELPSELEGRPNIGHQLSELTVNTLSQLHQVDIDAVGLSDLGKLEGFLERQIGGWYKRGARILDDSQMKLMSEIRDWLMHNLPEERVGALVHNDFKLDNMLLNPEPLSVSGVVDWDMCTIGDPYFELTILLSYWGDKNDLDIYDSQTRMPNHTDGWWSRSTAIERYFDSMGGRPDDKTLNFYWWLTQYRTVVVYAQLNVLFERQGTNSVFTESELSKLKNFHGDLLIFISKNLDIIPSFLES